MRKFIENFVPAILLFLLVIIAANTCSSQVDDFLLPTEMTGPYENNIEIWRVDTDSSVQFVMKGDSSYQLCVQRMSRTFQAWSTDSIATLTAYGFHMNDMWSIITDSKGEYTSDPVISSLFFFHDAKSGRRWLEFTDINGNVSPPTYLIE